MSLEQSVSQHYTHGNLEGALLAALQRAGKNLDTLSYADLALVDEFHIGGRPATRALGDQLDLPEGARVLDVGCGIGGAARCFASERGWKVEGVDLTAEYVEVATALSRRVGVEATFRQASATALPFDNGTFDGAYMLHVGMNIEDKAGLFAEVRRVLRGGGVFGVYDVMREGEGALSFPLPWATTPETSFVSSAADYRRLLGATGFLVRKERSRRDFAIGFFRQLLARAADPGRPPPLGLHLLMGATTPQKVANMIDHLQRGLIAPTEIVCSAA